MRRRLEAKLLHEFTERSETNQNTDTAATGLAGIRLSSRRNEGVATSAIEAATAPPPEEITTLLDSVVKRTVPTADVGWWSRYLLGNILVETGLRTIGVALLNELADTTWRKETVQVLFFLGNYEMEEVNDPQKAFDRFRQTAEAAKEFENTHAYVAASLHAALCTFYMMRYEETLQLVLSSMADPNQQRLHAYLSALAAECIEHLGGIEYLLINTPPPAWFAEIANMSAYKAVTRHALGEAETAWRAVLDRSPDSLFAIMATKGLIALAMRNKSDGDADTLAALRAFLQGLKSTWAEKQHPPVDATGFFSDQEIAEALNFPLPSLPAAPKTETERRWDFVIKLGGLYSHCAAAVGPRACLSPFMIEVQSGADGAVSAAVQPVYETADLDTFNDVSHCFVRDAPRYLKGVTRSYRAEVKTSWKISIGDSETIQ